LKRIIYISIFLILGVCNSSYSQRTEVEKYYVRIDTAFISKLTTAYNTSTEKLLSVLEVSNENRENLGFGYQLKDSGKGVGSISFGYQILYYNNYVVAYQLSTYIKSNKPKRIKKLYREKLSSIFNVDNKYKVQPISFGMDEVQEPLMGIDKRDDNNLNEIMIPFIGIVYGDYCGYSMSLLNNRKAFDDNIGTENCEYLLYSKNPATRLMAIEFFYCNQAEFNENQKQSIISRVEELKKKPMITKTCSGCFVGGEITEKLIAELENCK
jgi:hypothetical protein